MWRPFVFSLANHAYENFVKKIERADSAPPGLRGESVKSQKNKSCSGFSEEAQKRIEDFENLKKKVRKQREVIRIQEESLKRKEELRIRVCKENLMKIRKRRFEDMKKVRAMSSCKPKRVLPDKGVFDLTCVDTSRKHKNEGKFMEQIKNINKEYMKKIAGNCVINKESQYRQLKIRETLQNTTPTKKLYGY